MKQKTVYPIFLLVIIIVIIAVGVLNYSNISSDGNQTQNSQVNAALNKNFQVKLNQTAVISSENITITFLNVTEDSRCPEGAVCVWQGQVKALFIFKLNQSEETFNLTLNSNETQSQKNINGYLFKLVKIDPYPVSNQTGLNNYVATLYITSNDNLNSINSIL